jgi:hypothetical protein
MPSWCAKPKLDKAQVRSGLAAGAKGIRTGGPTSSGGSCRDLRMRRRAQRALHVERWDPSALQSSHRLPCSQPGKPG